MRAAKHRRNSSTAAASAAEKIFKKKKGSGRKPRKLNADSECKPQLNAEVALIGAETSRLSVLDLILLPILVNPTGSSFDPRLFQK